MCGIIGVIGHLEAEKQVAQALKLLHERGKDGQSFTEISKNSYFGHTLHSIVGHVQQPLQGKGTLVANCEIYNWKELSEKYLLPAKNDAELLLGFLDKFGLEKIEELDGVFAFAYYNEGKVFIVRDILGIKPLWFSITTEHFSFASEMKVLDSLNYLHVQELNPRKMIVYDIETKTITEKQREFFHYLPELDIGKEDILNKTQKLLHKAIEKRIPGKKLGLLFSGGIDSTYIANYLKNEKYEFTCYTVALETDGVVPKDLVSAREVAAELDLDLKVITIKQEDIPSYLEKIVPLIEDSNVVKVGVALTFYLACEEAKKDGCKVLFSGLGSEEIFAGYDRHKKSSNINQECVSGLLKMYERDLYRDDVLTMANNLELRLPFLDKELVSYALKIPEQYKIVDEKTKMVLREIALSEGIPEVFALRKKVAAQYGSRIDNALGKLSKKNGLTKSAYLRQFYPQHNLKLGVLFSSGKDSTYAAYIMQQQNYSLSCLITLKSANKDSYMFHTPAIELASYQAEAMGLPIIFQDTEGKKEKELDDLIIALKKAKEEFQIEGVVTGAIFSTYQRNRIEKICDDLGLKIFSPLWHKPQEKEMEELLQLGFKFIFTAIAGDGLNKSFLGKEIDNDDLVKLKKINAKNGLHVGGEGGEMESFVTDCPLFKKKLVIEDFEKVMENSFTGRLKIKKISLVEK
ncbi:diphthine--ammonia ligase [Candidatus Woesearchaeota archaeon]|jgi:diphthine-ammonia ligase|nr:diphthine--ammonia ligase [Candidatus Woesearchaeota archaeon]